MSRDEFGKPDVRFHEGSDNVKAQESLEKHRQNAEKIKVSPYLHQDVHEYIYRILNLYLLGWYYYPLCTVAESLSFLALEMALAKRYEYQIARRDRSLKRLLKRAVNEGDLDLKLSKRVQSIYEGNKQHYKMLGEFIPMDEPCLDQVAETRGKILMDVLPVQRGSAVHPSLTPLTMPHYAHSNIDELVDCMNILFQSYTEKFRKFSAKCGFDWSEPISFSPGANRGLELPSGNLVTDEEVCPAKLRALIDHVTETFGMEKSSSYKDLERHHNLCLVLSKAYRVLERVPWIFKTDCHQPITDTKIVKAVQLLPGRYVHVLSGFYPVYALETTSSKLWVRFTRKKKRMLCIVSQKESGEDPFISFSNKDYFYYRFLRIGLSQAIDSNLRYDLDPICKLVQGVSPGNKH